MNSGEFFLYNFMCRYFFVLRYILIKKWFLFWWFLRNGFQMFFIERKYSGEGDRVDLDDFVLEDNRFYKWDNFLFVSNVY